MSQENVEAVRRAVEALNRRDLDAFLATMDPEVEFYSRIVELEGGGPYRGHAGVRRWWDDLFAITGDISTEIEEIRDLGDVTVTRVRQRAHGLDSGAPMDQMQWFVTRWRNERTTWARVFVSQAEALRAAGLSE